MARMLLRKPCATPAARRAMNIEHSRGSAELEYIPDNDGLDKFDSETAGLVPVR